MPAPAPAICQEVIWKNQEVLGFAIALVKAALELLGKGVSQFTTDIVGDEVRKDITGNGIVGSVTTMLQASSVIKPAGITQDGVWYALRIKSKRANASARYVGVYHLTSRALAEEFLTRYEALVKPKEQEELIHA